MFSTRKYLEKRTGPHGVDRFHYLQSLVTEFQDIDSLEARQQVLANLANFAYDPINYPYLRALNVLDLFLDCLTESDVLLVEYGLGGLCNLVLDKENKKHLLENNAVQLVTQCLASSREETVVSAITTLMFLVTPESKSAVTSLPVVDAMLRFSKSSNPRISNLAHVFLQDYCNRSLIEQVQEAEAHPPSS